MITIQDRPEVLHDGAPIRRIDMTQMGPEEIRTMLEQSRDGFYSNKELAPVREYSTNARDAHIQSGIGSRPIEFTLPTQLAPELKIRDFGAGLTIDELTDVYFKYWKSTKRLTNDFNGCLGIGAKSAFAYSPVYTVTSWCKGMKIVATGQKDGYADVIYHQANTAGEPDGIEVAIPVLQKDIAKFVTEAMDFFKYWDIRPVFVNADEDALKEAFAGMDTPPFLSGDGWAVRPSGYGKGDSKAVMGFVPYSIDWKQVRNSLPPEVNAQIGGIFDFLEENLTTLYFANGTLSFTPNRESLQYNDVTLNAIVEKLKLIYSSLLTLITAKIADAPNLWEAKIRYNTIFRREMDGFDKEALYSGNLNAIENLLRGRIEWRGIVINNGMFEGLENWDKNDGKDTNRYGTDFEPILSTYVKDEKGEGVQLCKGRGRRRYHYNSRSIICSPKSIVIIQDTDKLSLAKGLARWFLYKANKPVSQVYVLDWSNQAVREAFIKDYRFETVPVSRVSKNIPLIKAYLKSVRATYTRTNNDSDDEDSTPAEKRPLNCPFVNIHDRKQHRYNGATWSFEDVNAKAVKGGVYVLWSKLNFTFNGRNIEHDYSKNFWQSIWELSQKAGADLPKVYGIYPRTFESAWFAEAKDDGVWISLESWVNENLDCLPQDVIKRVNAYYNATDCHLSDDVIERISPLVADLGNTAGKYFAVVKEVISNEAPRQIPEHLNLCDWANDDSQMEAFSKMNVELKHKYPLLYRLAQHRNIDNEEAREIAEYINMVDLMAPAMAPVPAA